MKKLGNIEVLVLVAAVFVVAALISTIQGQATKPTHSTDPEKAVLARLEEIQSAAQGLDPDKVFSMVLENDKGALVQNGRLFLTRKEALDSTKQGFQGLQKVEYKFDQQQVTMLSPSIALAVGEGSSSATTLDGRSFQTPFAQSVVMILTNGEWKVLHAHRSFRPAK